MRTRVATVTTVTLFAVAVALVAFVAGNGDGGGLVKLPVSSGGAAEAGDAAASTAMADRSSLIAPAYGWVEYRPAGDLPALPSEAAAYRLGSTASTDEVAGLARALGLAGEVREVDGAWAVRDGDRELRVQRVPGLPWYLGTTCEPVAGPDAPVGSDTAVTSRGCEVAVSSGGEVVVVEDGAVQGCRVGPEGCPAPDVAPPSPTAPAVTAVPAPAPCPPGAECAVASSPLEPVPAAAPCPPDARCAVDPAAPATTVACDAAGCPAPTEPAPVPEPMPVPERPARPADLPSRSEAERVARETFSRLGLGLDGFAVEDGWLTWEARVETRVDGIPVTGMGAWLGVGSGGRIDHGGGSLARPEKIGDYPLAGVETGLRRLNEGFGWGFPAMAAEGSGTDEAVATTIAPGHELRTAEERRTAEAAGQAGGGGSGQSGAGPAVDVPSPVDTGTGQSGAAPGTGQSGVDTGTGQSGAATGAGPAVDLPSPPADCGDPNVRCEPPVTIGPVPAPVPEKVVLDVTGVRLVLLHLDGALVPSYVFELADGGESPPVPAVTDEWLDTEGARTQKG